MPLAHAEVGVEVVRERVPRNAPSPSVTSSVRCQAGARARRIRGWCRGRSDGRGARPGRRGRSGRGSRPPASRLRPARRSGRRSADGAPRTGRAGSPAHRALEPVLLVDGHPRHSAALGGQGIAGAGQLLLLDQQLLRAASTLPETRLAACSWRVLLLARCTYPELMPFRRTRRTKLTAAHCALPVAAAGPGSAALGSLTRTSRRTSCMHASRHSKETRQASMRRSRTCGETHRPGLPSVPATKFLMLLDRDAGEGLAIAFFDSKRTCARTRRGAERDEPSGRLASASCR